MKKLIFLLCLFPVFVNAQNFMIHQKPFASSPPLSRLILLDDGAGNYTSTSLQKIIDAVPIPEAQGDGFVDGFTWNAATRQISLTQDGANNFSVTLPDYSYTLPTASNITLGGVKVGSGGTNPFGGLYISNGFLQVKLGDGLSYDGNGGITANSTGYTLPAATDATRGGIRAGGSGGAAVNGLQLTGDFLSVSTGGGIAIFGGAVGVNYGTGLEISGNQLVADTDYLASRTWVSQNFGGSYSLPAATASVRGGIKVGDNLSVSGDILSADMPQFAKQSYSSFSGVQINGSTYTDIGSRTFTVSGTNMILVKATTRAGVSETHINYRLYINGTIREQQTMANWSNVSTDNFLSLTDWEIVNGNVTIKVDAVTNDGISSPIVSLEDVEIMIIPIL